MGKDKFKVMKNENPKRGYTVEEESLALDYQYGLRKLNKFEEKKAEQINERLEDLYEYMETTRLY